MNNALGSWINDYVLGQPLLKISRVATMFELIIGRDNESESFIVFHAQVPFRITNTNSIVTGKTDMFIPHDWDQLNFDASEAANDSVFDKKAEGLIETW